MMYQWAVVGAGPSGIAVVGKLIDSGVKPSDIAWIDPQFKVGDFGLRWGNVPSNTRVSLFSKFLHAVDAFDYKNCPHDFELNRADPEKNCYLRLMREPLQWVTDHLKTKVHCIEDMAVDLSLKNRVWQITLNHSKLTARNAVLAIGAEAKQLAYTGVDVVPLQDAMDSDRIHHHCKPEDTVAVFGSSHSAILALRNLVESGVKRVINFYRAPLRYAVYLDDWILFDDTGLKGPTAEWAREHIDGTLPKNLERVYSNDENIEQYLPQCNKVVYAVGFSRRTLPIVEGAEHLTYIEQCGIIAPGLFGFGIAFPEGKYNPFDMYEYRVGLWKFMDYLQRVMPVWLKYTA